MTTPPAFGVDTSVSWNLGAEDEKPLTASEFSCSGEPRARKEQAMVASPRSVIATHPRLRVEALADAVVEAHGHDPRSAYARQFWLPLVGPSTLLAAGALVAGLEHSPAGFEVELARLGRALGVPGAAGGNAKIARTLERLARFGLAEVHATTGIPLLRVRRSWPPLTARQLGRLPGFLVRLHPAA